MAETAAGSRPKSDLKSRFDIDRSALNPQRPSHSLITGTPLPTSTDRSTTTIPSNGGDGTVHERKRSACRALASWCTQDSQRGGVILPEKGQI
jgi:hypothetical protein